MTYPREAGSFEECLTRMSGHPDIGWVLMAEECDWSVDMLRKASNENHEPRVHLSIQRAVRLDRLWMRTTKRAPLFAPLMRRRVMHGVETAVSPDDLHALLRDLNREQSEVMDAFLTAIDPASRGGVLTTEPELKAILAELEDVARAVEDALTIVRGLLTQFEEKRGAA